MLVPGAGLGRLAFDIACAGFNSQGNEFSYYMLIGAFSHSGQQPTASEL